MTSLLSFSVEEIRCSVRLEEVTGMIRMVQILPGGNLSYGVAGLINLHGSLVEVISMRKIFGYPDRPPRISDTLIIFREDTETFALWVDETYILRDESPGRARVNQKTKYVNPYIEIKPDGTVFFTDIGITVRSLMDEKNSLLSLLTDNENSFFPVHEKCQDDETGPSEEKAMSVLRSRAEDLARPEEIVREQSLIEVIRFQLSGREYALEMRYIREVIQTREITPVPGTPDHILGICAVRGEIITLVDLRSLFALPEQGLTDLNKVVILTDGLHLFGILADEITGIGTVAMDQVITIPGNDQVYRKYFKGTTPESLVVLNTEVILTDPSLIVDESEE